MGNQKTDTFGKIKFYYMNVYFFILIQVKLDTLLFKLNFDAKIKSAD
jgi:hypothetical protein